MSAAKAARSAATSVVEMTNATKAQLMALAQAVLGLMQVFNVELSYVQWGAIQTTLGAVFSVWVTATYRRSTKRVDTTSKPRR